MIERTAINGALDRLERLGAIMHDVGVPLILVLFVAVYFGWLSSPLLDRAESIEARLVTHDGRVVAVIAQRSQETRMLAEALTRLAEILKMIDCGAIEDRALRERCLAR